MLTYESKLVMNRVKRQQLLQDQKIAPQLRCAGRVPLDFSVHDKYIESVYGKTKHKIHPDHHPGLGLGQQDDIDRRRRQLEHLLRSEERRAFSLQKAEILKQAFSRKFDRAYVDVVSHYVSRFVEGHSAGYTRTALELLEEQIRCAIILNKAIDK